MPVGLIIMLLRRRWGIVIIGAILVVAGLVWGLASQQIAFTSFVKGGIQDQYNVYSGNLGNTYITIKGSSNTYIAQVGDIQPAIDQTALNNAASLSFVASSQTADVQATLEGNTVTSEYIIEKITFYDNNGTAVSTSTTADYNAHPNGFTQDNWSKSIWLILVGILMAGAALIYPLISKKPQPSASFNIGVGGVQQPYAQPQQPYAQPYQPQQPYAQPPQANPNPYAQSYQGTEQYPQNPPYPPQG